MVNLKTEIIYYNCHNDFVFEFNLNTAVQIRLFTEAPATDKAFLSALALAVSRSRAIIITSEFNDELITKLAGSIGFKTESINPEEYGILSMPTNKLITGGVPLVNEDGVYGGIILESGPQSLIIITNDQKIRKQLMDSLVHPYLNDVLNAVNGNTAVTATDAVIEEKTETAIIEETTSDETAVINTVVDEDIDDDVQIDEIIDDKSTVDTADETFIEDVDDENTEIDDDSSTENIIYIDFDDESTDDTAVTQPPQKKRAIDIFTIILAIILFVLVGFIVYSLIIEPFINGISLKENFQNIFGFFIK